MKNLNNYTKEIGSDETIPIWFDKHFKLLFGNKNHLELTRFLISTILNKEIDKVELLDTELIEESRMDKVNTVDLALKFDTEYVSIEANSSFGDVIKDRNLTFLFRIQSRQLKSGEDYNELKKHYQINLNQEDFDNEHVNICHIRSDNTGKIYSNLFEIHNINVKHFAHLADKCYNEGGDKLSLRDKLFALIGTNKKSVIDRLTLDNDTLKEIGKMAKRYSEDKHLLQVYNREELLKADLRHEYAKKLDAEVAKKVEEVTNELEDKVTRKVTDKVTKEVTDKVTKEVTEKKVLDIAIKMKNENIDLETISKVTNLSIEIIEKL